MKTKMVVACKSDLINDRKVCYEEGLTFAKSINASYIEVSSKSNINVEALF